MIMMLDKAHRVTINPLRIIRLVPQILIA
jgi:hypothetical protein